MPRIAIAISLPLLLAACLWPAGLARAARAPALSNYQAIVERNVFGLRPPPPPTPPPNESPLAPKLYLQGITTILNVKKALIKVQPQSRPGQPPQREESLILAEGQGEGGVEVVRIDARAGRVHVNSFGTPMDIDFENNGVKPTAAPSPAQPPPHAAAPPATTPPPARGLPTLRPGAFPRQLPPLPGS